MTKSFRNFFEARRSEREMAQTSEHCFMREGGAPSLPFAP